MMTRQGLLPLPRRDRRGRADFLVTRSNAEALAALADWRRWPAHRQLVCGPAGSGRSHLAAIWAHETGAHMIDCATPQALPRPDALPPGGLALDNADATAGIATAEEALFHLLNATAAARLPVLLTAHETPGAWGLRLPDLESRLQTCAVARVQAPDDMLLEMVLYKLFDDRQLDVSPAVVTYLVRRMDRSLDRAAALVDCLDRQALGEHKPVTIAMAKALLERTAQGASPDAATGPRTAPPQ